MLPRWTFLFPHGHTGKVLVPCTGKVQNISNVGFTDMGSNITAYLGDFCMTGAVRGSGLSGAFTVYEGCKVHLSVIQVAGVHEPWNLPAWFHKAM